MASQTTTHDQSWTDNSYVVALFQVLMGIGLVWLIRSTFQLMRYTRKGASNDNEPVSTPNHGGSADLELGELHDQQGHDIDLEAGLEANPSINLPQRVHLPQEHGHRERADDTTNIGGLAGSESGELNRQEVDDIDFEVGHEAIPGISLPQRVHLPQEHGHRGRADNTTNIGGVAGFESGELNRQEVDDNNSEVRYEATPGINLLRRVSPPREHDHGQRTHKDHAPTLGGQHV